MDVTTRGVPPTLPEQLAIESVLGPAPDRSDHHAVGGHALRALRHLLLPTLHAVNDRVGWLSQEAIDHIAERLDLGPAEVYGVATFYGLFSTSERSTHQVHVCIDLACRSAGGPTEAGLPDGTHASPCLGMCERAPAAFVVDAGSPVEQAVSGPVTRAEPRPVAAGAMPGPEAFAGPVPHRRRTRPAAPGGPHRPARPRRLPRRRRLRGAALARDLGPEAVIEAGEGVGSRRTRRGGIPDRPSSGRRCEASPTPALPGVQRRRVGARHVQGPHAHRERPVRVDRGAVDRCARHRCEQGYIYIRGEYPRARLTLQAALAACRARGLIGSGTGFELTLVRGAGAYICGEETAIFNSIEGYRGEPRNKPPFPFQAGLFGKPTVVNNVETLMNVPYILLDGHATEHRLYCLSGAVQRPGVYEVPHGETLGELIELAGGLRDGSELRAVLLGGAAGNFVGPDDLDLVLTPDDVRAAGLSLGSGVVMVIDQHVELSDLVRRIAAFFRDESCGQCVPCRVGTVRQEEAIERILAGGDDRDTDLALLDEIGAAMRDASICGLGQTAYNAIESAVVRLGALR
jgi:NADH-quinone oxidoreductase subunit F